MQLRRRRDRTAAGGQTRRPGITSRAGAVQGQVHLVQELLLISTTLQIPSCPVSDIVELRRTAETHELAKRKAREMDKIRAAFGLGTDVKEGQAFDRDLQEQLKAQRIAEREAQRLAKEKEARKREKAAKKAKKEREKAEKNKAKEAKKAQAKAEKVRLASTVK